MNTEKITDINKIDDDQFKDDVITLYFNDDMEIIKTNSLIHLGSMKLNIFSFIDYNLYNEILQDIREFNKFILVIDNKETEFNFKYFKKGCL